MRGSIVSVYACLAVFLVAPAYAQGGVSPVGSVKIARGEAVVVRNGTVQPLRTGALIFEGDALRTAADGSIGVILRDDTRLSLGPETEIRIDHFLFAPGEGKLSLVLRMLKGVAAYVSGKIGKLSPGSVHFETPVATVGIRGTQFAAQVTAP